MSVVDLANYFNGGSLFSILLAVLIVDMVVILLVRYYPNFFGKTINKWYDLFGLNAVLSDVFIIVIGFLIARYIYTKMGWEFSLIKFLILLVVVQLVHDLLFYWLVIKPFPMGHNTMMDVFKEYSSAGYKILIADAMMMIGSGLIAYNLIQMKDVNQYGIGILMVYILPYLLYKKV